MAICREFYFPSSDGSSRIHAAEWTPESGEIIGVYRSRTAWRNTACATRRLPNS